MGSSTSHERRMPEPEHPGRYGLLNRPARRRGSGGSYAHRGHCLSIRSGCHVMIRSVCDGRVRQTQRLSVRGGRCHVPKRCGSRKPGALEIPDICSSDGEYKPKSRRCLGRHLWEACVIDLHPSDRVGHDHAPPLAGDRLTIGPPREATLHALRPTVSLQRREPIAMALGWTRGDIPELRHGLRRITEAGALHEQRAQGSPRQDILYSGAE